MLITLTFEFRDDDSDELVKVETQLDTDDPTQSGELYEHIDRAVIDGNLIKLVDLQRQAQAYLEDHSSLKESDSQQNAMTLLSDLERSINGLVLRMVTRLLYRATRVGDWNAPECKFLRDDLEITRPTFMGWTQLQYAKWIAEQESELRDFFGDDLSDDSDDEEQRGHPSYRFAEEEAADSEETSQAPKKGGVVPLGPDVMKSMPKGVNTPFKGSKKTVRSEKEWGSVSANAEIHYPDNVWTKEVLADLKTVNEALAQGNRKVDTLTKTRFCVAQYRGIAYNVTSFGARARRANRSTVETKRTVFANAVFDLCGVSPGQYYAGHCPSEKYQEMIAVAEDLRNVLLAKRESKPIMIGDNTYASEAYALQDLYTKGYDAFHRELMNWLKTSKEASSSQAESESLSEPYSSQKRKHDEAFSSQAESKSPYGALFEGLKSAKNPFVSTGNTPRHALRYAYGIKFYEGHQHERLRPRWNASGRAERPYGGKVYISLHPPSDYLYPGPLDVIALNRHGRVSVVSLIAAERETTFPAYLPADRVFAEHIARYPSFHLQYKPGYLDKYGLSEDDYEQFKKLIVKTKPHGESHKKNKLALGEWLVRYYEARLVELARREANRRGMVLVYRDDGGFLSPVLPKKYEPVGLDASRSTGSPGGVGSSNTVGGQSRKGTDLEDAVEDQVQVHPPLTFEIMENTYRRSAQFARWLRERFHIHHTPPDGNCLFHAMSQSLNQGNYSFFSHQDLRAHAVEQLRQNGVTEDLTELEQVATDPLQIDRWGTDREVVAIARCFRLNIRVYAPSEPNGFTDFQFGADNTMGIILYHVGGDHWEWLEPKNAEALTDKFINGG